LVESTHATRRGAGDAATENNLPCPPQCDGRRVSTGSALRASIAMPRARFTASLNGFH
jgi:hypothetical protein